MKKTLQHRIDIDGQNIFKTLLPTAWVIDKYEHDYAKDYLVEIVDDQDELTGETFVVQLKSKQKLACHSSAKSFTFPLEQKHVRYYIDKCKLPVCLVVVDVKAQKAYFSFVQHNVLSTFPDKSWREKKKVPIKINLEDNFEDLKRFADAFRLAQQKQGKRWPGDLQAAAEAEKKRLLEIDPRFEPSIIYDNNKLQIVMQSRENNQGEIKIIGTPERVRQAHADMFGRGVPVTFQPGELILTGSPHFDETLKSTTTMKVTKTLPLTLNISVINKTGQEIASLPVFEGVLEGGFAEQRFHARKDGLPISFEFILGPSGLPPNYVPAAVRVG